MQFRWTQWKAAHYHLVSFGGKRPVGKLMHRWDQHKQEEYMAQYKRRVAGPIDGTVKLLSLQRSKHCG
jgi:hypothetical protein